MTHATFDAPQPDRAFDAPESDRAFDAPTVIRTKRDGGALSDAAIDWVIDAYTHGRIADAQMSALLMAIFLRGMSGAEITRWTAAMIASGERFDFGDLRRDGTPLALVDKHSTGGVGDKITIPLVPVVMACGVGAAGGRARARPHRRHAGQAGIHRGIHRRVVRRPDTATTPRHRGGSVRRR